ncbi:hypothetical protein Bca52824_002858 [Brassica carinata]|uniref:Uncharacterized protein n=1 Tax=Brassica carinata TaxID=52824 RepID=A0A8X7WP56_BRACI|nr:hypothetical protein Bca52824_002858 [Brassica carinata]
MEKREPSLVPEWLRSKGNGSGVGSKNHIQSSSARSDSSVSPFLDRSSPTDAPRRSTKNAYRNFYVQRRERGKDRRMGNDRPTYIDPSDHATSFPLGTSLNESNQEQLRRSNPVKTRKHGDNLAQGLTMGFKDGRSIYNKNHMLPRTSHAVGNEGGPDVVRISSPGLTLAVQSLSVGDSGLTAGEGWKPAPAEVPNVIEKSGSDSVVTSVTLTGQTRNMAEALLQGPRTGTLPQESSKIQQRVEDRALKLIPILPSAPKGSKAKPMVRSGATGLASFKNTHQHSSMQIKPDSTKKLVILKPAVKESGSSSRVTNSQATGFQKITAPSAPFITSVAKTQSRNAFYSSLKKKTSTNISTSSCIVPSAEEKEDMSKELIASDPSSVHAAERDGIVTERVEKVSEAAERDSGFDSTDIPDEIEAEFLKSLGWDENNTEVEPLTDEEIRAFYEQFLISLSLFSVVGEASVAL